MPASIRLMIFLFFLMNASRVRSQKLYFRQYNIEQGLGQSQVTGIAQDKNDNLWIATLGGISKFDGKSFTNYSETEGLSDNNTNCIYADSKNEIWTGTNNGLSCLRNSIFKNYRFPGGVPDNFIRAILEDTAGEIIVLTLSHLFIIGDQTVHLMVVDNDSSSIIMSVAIDQRKRLWAAVRHKGIYCRENGSWIKKADLKNNVYDPEYFRQLSFDPLTGDLLLLSLNKLFTVKDGTVQPANRILPLTANSYISLFFDRNQEAWLIDASGVYHNTAGHWQYYQTGNGYTNIPTTCVMQDHENNIWLGTSGAGIFQFHQQPYIAYDQFGSANAIVMQLITGKDNKIYLGTDGSGLFSFQNNHFDQYKLPSADKSDQRIISLVRGKGDDLLLSTRANMIWRFAGNHFEAIILKGFRSCINSLNADDSGKIWICACDGLYYYQNGKLEKVSNQFTSRLFLRPGNQVMRSYYRGLGFFHGWGTDKFIEDSLIFSSHIMNILFKGKYYVIGTSNRGLLIYDTVQKKTSQYSIQNGLNSNFVYSVVEDQKGQIWLGTGHGLNKLYFDTLTGRVLLTNESSQGDISSSEFNEGAALCSDSNTLWFGTATGLMRLKPDSIKRTSYMPPLVFKTPLPANGLRSHQQNQMAFDFNCASYEFGKQIFYQFRLSGIDQNYSELSPAQNVIYSHLPPGKYLFNARAFNRQTGAYSNTISYPFEIRPAFYQTVLFKIVVFILLASALYSAFRYRSIRKEKRFREIENIRQNEQIKLRQQATEDFHDEMGNTITRIQLLADVVRSKLLKGNTDVNVHIDRIKENVSSLYQGTRDIIWALNPKSDHLEEVIYRLSTTGSELFNDTETTFSFHNHIHHDVGAILPGHTGRNILLIFKEAMNNIVKHAKATAASLTIEKTGHQVLIVLQDNGNGFIDGNIKKGYGTVNMAKRAERIDGVFTIESGTNCGTRCQLLVNIPRFTNEL